MDKILDIIGKNEVAIYILLLLATVIGVTTVILFAVAFAQGRSIAFWPPSIGARPGRLKTGRKSPLTILIADNNTDYLETLKEIFENDENRNYALAYGKKYRRVLIDLDVDSDKGLDGIFEFEKLAKEHGFDLDTLVSGGTCRWQALQLWAWMRAVAVPRAARTRW